MGFSRKFPRAAVIAGFLLILCCTEPETPAASPLVTTNSKPQEEQKAVCSYITIIAAGDNLIHDIIYNSARVSGNEESFNFEPNYAQISPIIKKADIAFVNQETVMGGRQIGYSGYPVFNTPQEAGLGLIKAGFNVVNHASNHVMDKGEGAVYDTMDFWESQGIPCLGIFRSEEQRKTERRIIEKNGIKTGFLSYTYALNGFSLPKDKPWMVGIIDKEVMAREIDDLRPYCDLLVVSMHWGNEFQHTVSDEQKDLARFMALHNVDLIIGHHPHVTAPVEVMERPDGKKLFVFYSLGDLLSHTQSDWTLDTMTGALAYIRIKKTQLKSYHSTAVETALVIPTVCHYGRERRSPFIAYPLWDYTAELASKHYKSGVTLEYLKGAAGKVFGNRILEKDQYERLSP